MIHIVFATAKLLTCFAPAPPDEPGLGGLTATFICDVAVCKGACNNINRKQYTLLA